MCVIFSKSAVLVLLSAAIVAASSRFITSVTPVAAPTCFECSDHTCHSVPETKAGQCPRHTYATRAQCEMGCKPIPTYRCVTASGRSGCQLAPNGTGGDPLNECKAMCKPPPPPPPPPPAPPFPPLPPMPGPANKCNYSVLWGVDGTNGSAFGDHLQA
jgi:hypothetical protein